MDDFCAALRREFRPSNFYAALRMRLWSLRQLYGVQSYVYEFHILIGQIGDVSENEATFLNLGKNITEIIGKILNTPVSSVLLTRGHKGAILGIKNAKDDKKAIYNVPAFPSHPIDETGAGDVFLFCYAIHHYTHNDSLGAMAFATSIASIMIEQNRFSWHFSKEKINSRQKQIQSNITELEL